MTDIAARRLHAHRLTGEPFDSAVEAVTRLVAVQAQDLGGALWGLGQRTRGATAAEIGRLLDDGALLRTHVLRPTWHLVTPEDIGWLLALTGPVVRRGLAARHRELGITDALLADAGAAMATALEGGTHLTRTELAQVLRDAGIAPDGQRLPHLLLAAELDGTIVNGRRRGRQTTYARLSEGAPARRARERDEALAALARRFVHGHGPAQLQDFVWWSGLPVGDARTGIARAGTSIAQEVVDGKAYWLDPAARAAEDAGPLAHLLPNYDEYTVAYRDRADLLAGGRAPDPTIFSFGSVLSNVLVIRGRVRGAWRRTVTRGGVRVEVRLIDGLTRPETDAVAQAAQRLGRFLECPAELTVVATATG